MSFFCEVAYLFNTSWQIADTAKSQLSWDCVPWGRDMDRVINKDLALRVCIAQQGQEGQKADKARQGGTRLC